MSKSVNMMIYYFMHLNRSHLDTYN